MTDEIEKLTEKVMGDLGELIHWTARPEVTRTIRKTLQQSHADFVRLNKESYQEGRKL